MLKPGIMLDFAKGIFERSKAGVKTRKSRQEPPRRKKRHFIRSRIAPLSEPPAARALALRSWLQGDNALRLLRGVERGGIRRDLIGDAGSSPTRLTSDGRGWHRADERLKGSCIHGFNDDDHRPAGGGGRGRSR